MKVIKQWSGLHVTCHYCKAIFHMEQDDVIKQCLHTRSDSMLQALIADKGGLMWTACPNCETVVQIVPDDIPLYYRKFVVVKKAPAV